MPALLSRPMTRVPGWRVERLTETRAGRWQWVGVWNIGAQDCPTAADAVAAYQRRYPALASNRERLRARPCSLLEASR